MFHAAITEGLGAPTFKHLQCFARACVVLLSRRRADCQFVEPLLAQCAMYNGCPAGSSGPAVAGAASDTPVTPPSHVLGDGGALAVVVHVKNIGAFIKRYVYGERLQVNARSFRPAKHGFIRVWMRCFRASTHGASRSCEGLSSMARPAASASGKPVLKERIHGTSVDVNCPFYFCLYLPQCSNCGLAVIAFPLGVGDPAHRNHVPSVRPEDVVYAHSAPCLDEDVAWEEAGPHDSDELHMCLPPLVRGVGMQLMTNPSLRPEQMETTLQVIASQLKATLDQVVASVSTSAAVVAPPFADSVEALQADQLSTGDVPVKSRAAATRAAAAGAAQQRSDAALAGRPPIAGSAVSCADAGACTELSYRQRR